MTRPAQAAAIAVAIGFLALHLPYLPASLEDLDSINFALGLRHYDVAQHQPHPPGYPVFIAIGRVARHVTASEAHALSAIGIVAGALGVLALFVFFRQLENTGSGRTRPTGAAAWRTRAARRAGPSAPATPADTAPGEGRAEPDLHAGPAAWIAWAGALVATTSPLYWFTAARPLSDTTGLAAALGVQAWTLVATTRASFAAAAFFAGLAAGIRSQVVWLTVPLLVLAAYRRRRDLGLPLASVLSWIWPFALGCLIWAIPLVLLSGGPQGYWRAVFAQGAEDLTGIQMLWTTPTPRVFASALYYAFVAPWALWSVAVVVLIFATFGAALMVRYARLTAATLAVAYVPYLVFDLLFQETFTTRYALPLVVPVAYLTVRGAAAFGWRPALLVAVVLSMYEAHIGGTSIAAYAREKAPAFRLLDDMPRAAPQDGQAPVLAMDRREQLDLRRPIAWVGHSMPAFERRLPSPPQFEWLELVRYWSEGGRHPVWFVADPKRTDIDLVQHDDPIRYRWSVPYPVLLGGVRPNEMDWYRIGLPAWYVGQGWALTPEAGGVSDLAGAGLAHGPIEGRVQGGVVASAAGVVLGGRNFESTLRPRITIKIGTIFQKTFTVTPGPFLEVERLPGMALDPSSREFLPLSISADPRARVAIEQFDIEAATRVVFGFGDGWHEQEYNPSTGMRWRWLSERGELQVLGNRRPIRLHLEGEAPKKYFSRASRLTVKVGSTLAFDDRLSDDFSVDVTIPAEIVDNAGDKAVIVLETDQAYVPAERSSRTRDRRHLGLRIFKCELRSVLH